MQMLPVLLILIVHLSVLGVARMPGWSPPSLLVTLPLAFGPIIVLIAMLWVSAFQVKRRLSRGNAVALRAMDRRDRLARSLILAHHATLVLGLGWVESIRAAIGNLVLIDELVAITPAMLGLVMIWYISYPIERIAREAPIMRALDEGRPVYHMPGRWSYVWVQVRLHLLLLLVPLLLIVGLTELFDDVIGRFAAADSTVWMQEIASLIGVVIVFVFAPVLARGMLAVEPLGPGPLRDDLLEVCAAHDVQVRNILVWRTGNAMINAAVMGLVGRLRYVLLTDGLLELMPRDQVVAVMAHEIGHVRRHHLPWMLVMMITVMGLAVLLVGSLLSLVGGVVGTFSDGAVITIDLASILAALLLAMVVFGWISRRFERQADTFAAQHLSTRDGTDEDGVISADAVFAIAGALGSITMLNGVDPNRWNWRHGSIRWRQTYLQSLIGRTANALPIDRFVHRMKAVAAAAFIVLLAAQAWIVMHAATSTPGEMIDEDAGEHTP